MFLSTELTRLTPDNKTIVVGGGGFPEEQQVASNKHIHNLSSLRATNEEADTRLMLHAIHYEARNVVVLARDTDVQVLLIGHI